MGSGFDWAMRMRWVGLVAIASSSTASLKREPKEVFRWEIVLVLRSLLARSSSNALTSRLLIAEMRLVPKEGWAYFFKSVRYVFLVMTRMSGEIASCAK